MHKHSPWLKLSILCLIIFLGFYFRCESVLKTKVFLPLRADAGIYFNYAQNLHHRHIYSQEVGNAKNSKLPVKPDAMRSPGYPLFLTLFINGQSNDIFIEKIVISQAIISSLTIIVAFFFFRRFLPFFWGAVASLFVALSPHLIVLNSYILSETLFCFLIVFFGWLIGLFRAKPSFWLGVIIGVVLGIASLVRPSIQYFPAFLLFFLIFYYGRRKGIYYTAFVCIGFALVFSPWITRNMVTLGTPTDKTLMINFLHHGMYPDFTFNNIKRSYGYPYAFDPRSDQIRKNIKSVLNEISRRFHEETVRHVKWFFFNKPIVFWAWNNIQGISGHAFIYSVSKSPYFSKKHFQWAHYFMYFAHWPMVILCAFGCLIAWFPLSRIGLSENVIFIARFVSLLHIYFTLIHMSGAPFPRYSFPLRPYLFGMAMFIPYFLHFSINKKMDLEKLSLPS